MCGTEGWVPLSPGPQAGAHWQSERLHVRVLEPVLGWSGSLDMDMPMSGKWGNQGRRNFHVYLSHDEYEVNAPKHCNCPQDFRGS